jgi:hypothetical protein
MTKSYVIPETDYETLYLHHRKWYEASQRERLDPDAAMVTFGLSAPFPESMKDVPDSPDLVRPFMFGKSNGNGQLVGLRNDAESNECLPAILNLLRLGKGHLMLAGGAALYILAGGVRPDDYDVFFYGTDDVMVAAEFIKGVVATLQVTDFKVDENSRTVTFYVKSDPSSKGRHKIQIILRAFTTPASILNGFDIQACKVGIYISSDDVAMVACLPTWIESITNKTIWVDPINTMPSYKYRLAKYWSKGFDVELLDTVVPGSVINEIENVLGVYLDGHLGREIWPSTVRELAMKRGVAVSSYKNFTDFPESWMWNNELDVEEIL